MYHFPCSNPVLCVPFPLLLFSLNAHCTCNYIIIADFSALYCALSYDHKCLLTIFYACYMFYCIFVVCYMYTAFSLYTMFNHAPLLIYTFATTRHGVYTEDFLREGPYADQAGHPSLKRCVHIVQWCSPSWLTGRPGRVFSQEES